jgi:hypothetical protein
MFHILTLLKPKNITLIAAAIALSATTLYIVDKNRTIKSLTVQNAELVESKIILETANTIQKNTIDYLQKQVKIVEQSFKQTEQQFIVTKRDAEYTKNQLLLLNLNSISLDAPNIAEINVNNTSTNINKCYELLSGVPLSDAEKNQQNTNSICPWFFKP